MIQQRLDSGVVGGPFDPATTVYTVSNPTRDPANYQIALGGGTAPLLINGGAIWALWHFTRGRQPRAREPGVVTQQVAPST